MDFEVRRRVECANIESAAEGRNLWWHDWCQQRHSSGAALWRGADVESGGVDTPANETPEYLVICGAGTLQSQADEC